MHIPDGYLSPIFSLGTSAVTVPLWGLAGRRVQAVLNHRTVPLLSIFAALSFTIMMFNIPVPGGTTAHGVGGTLIAIVLGPWAAIIGVSLALILQALFFGDGGVLAIFANCLNMGIVLPFAGYVAYRLIAGRAPLLSARRAWAAGVGAYVGITVSALAVGIELGVQPLLFQDAAGLPLYSPYGLEAALPAMMVAHIFGASIVEALITGLGVAYLQKHHPEYLTGLRTVVAGADVPEGRPVGRPMWQIVAMVTFLATAIMLMAGLVTGGGDVGHLFGADWSAVNWPDVATMLVIIGGVAVVSIPPVWLLLPRRIKGVGTAFTALAVLAPLGLIAPGFAYGEGSPEDVQAAFGYVPKGLQDLSGVFSAPLAGYNVPLPFFSHANSALWQSAIGYEISGMLGILSLGLLTLGLSTMLRQRVQQPSTTFALPVGSHHHHGAGEGHIGWFEHTVAGIAGSIERAVFSEELAREPAWLQRVDPRAKMGMFVVLVLVASLANSLLVLAVLYAGILLAARASRVPLDFFVRRVWLGIPFFAGMIIIPSIFLAAGPRLFDVALGPLHIAPSIAGLLGAVVFVARVGVSVSLAVLLVLTTSWADVLKSLQALRVPQVFILLLSMTYRYIFLFLHAMNLLFEARKSRMVGHTDGGEHRRWITTSMMGLLNRSFKMSNDVYSAMMARGFTGTVRTYNTYRMRSADWGAVAGALALAALVWLVGRTIG
ncbi:MAG TPA: cobalt transporter CbiM [Chloroflexia bacterium]|nr:cobalt transporter CbiM [Chloroflexia bacterium]